MASSRFAIFPFALLALSACGSSPSHPVSSEPAPGERPIDFFLASLKEDNATIVKDDGGVSYYYGEATMEYGPEGKQEGYLTNGGAGIYDFTFREDGSIALGQFYSDGTFLQDGVNLRLLSGFSGDEVAFSKSKEEKGTYDVFLSSLLARYLYQFSDWMGTHFTELTSLTMALGKKNDSLSVHYVYQDSFTEENVERS